MSEIRRIGILTSGGDCAGLNAAVRAVTLHAHGNRGWTVVGIQKGTLGLLSRPLQYEVLEPKRFTGQLLRLGGTVLGTTNKGDAFDYPMPDGTRIDRSEEIIEGYRQLRLDGLIGIGGDGSFAILRRLAQQGDIRLVGIPKTIDNDVGSTETAVGHASAVAAATEALDHLQPTAASHDRVMVLEVMGRDAGHIALSAGIAGGADAILIPEIPATLTHVAEKIRTLKAHGRNFALVIVAEAVRTETGEAMRQAARDTASYGGIGHWVAAKLEEMTGAETRVAVLGHIQRGGKPIAQDRLIASAFGVHAVDVLAEGRHDRLVAWRDRIVIDVPLEDAIRTYSAVDVNGPLVHTARALGISFGDGVAMN